MDKDIAQTMMFDNFYVHCQRDSARLRSHEEISQHRILNKEDKDAIGLRMICGECGGLFTSARSLAQHINRRGFRHRTSKIVNYDKNTFDPNAAYQIRDTPSQKTTGPPPSNLDPRRRTASEDRQRIAAKAALVAPPRDDTLHAYDTHFSNIAVQARYNLLALTQTNPDDYQASPKFPTRQALHTFTNPPGLSLPQIPLTSTPLSRIVDPQDLDDVEQDTDSELPASQQPHTTQETDSQPEIQSQVQPPIGAIIQIADSPTTKINLVTESTTHMITMPHQQSHIDMPTFDDLFPSKPPENPQTTVTSDSHSTFVVSTPPVDYPPREGSSFIVHTLATSTPLQSPVQSPLASPDTSFTRTSRSSVIMTSFLTSYPHLLSVPTTAFSTTTSHSSVIMTSLQTPSLRPLHTSTDAYPYMVALVRHLEWLIRLLTTTFANTPIPPHVLALDMIDRATVARSPFWPRDLPRGAGLLAVLERLVGEYNNFLDNFPH